MSEKTIEQYNKNELHKLFVYIIPKLESDKLKEERYTFWGNFWAIFFLTLLSSPLYCGVFLGLLRDSTLEAGGKLIEYFSDMLIVHFGEHIENNLSVLANVLFVIFIILVIFLFVIVCTILWRIKVSCKIKKTFRYRGDFKKIAYQTSFIPPRYRNFESINEMKGYLENNKASTWQGCVGLWHKHLESKQFEKNFHNICREHVKSHYEIDGEPLACVIYISEEKWKAITEGIKKEAIDYYVRTRGCTVMEAWEYRYEEYFRKRVYEQVNKNI